MGRVSNLIRVGYSREEAEYLSQHEYFKHKTKTAEELLAVFQKIADIYDCDIDFVKKAVMKWPQFAGYDHERVVAEASAVYGDEKAVKKVVMKHPPFVGLNHERVVREASAVYGDEKAVKKVVMKHPAFAGRNHEKVVAQATAVYGDEEAVKRAVIKHPFFANYNHEKVVAQATAVYGNEEAVKRVVMKFPQFAGYDHERVVRQATAVYGDEEAVKRAVMKFPQFASYDHERVLRQKTVVFGAVGLSKEKIIEIILNRPSLASYSAVRDIAGLDVGKELKKEGFEPDEEMLKAYFSYVGKSPYVPGTRRLRIGKARRNSSVVYKEPPLLKAMRKRLGGRA